MACISDVDAIASSSIRISTSSNPYILPNFSPSSSSPSSIFSIDASSTQSSAPSSSTSSLNGVWENEDETSYFSSHHNAQQAASACSDGTINVTSYPTDHTGNRIQPPVETVALESRQHPRRTQRFTDSTTSNGGSAAACPRPPPSLVRQCERKDNFVDSLVDTTTQMIETIWPLSVLSCGRDIALGGKIQNLIGLRTFVQEVLRRSKTSYSTLQVALYYLVLIQSCIPKNDFTMEQLEDTQSCRAMQCGRRMFLAALILASKYLQDRNFSARAWSKISGLKTFEINTNEMAFLSAVNWKLHIPEPVFHRWTDIVLKYSPSAQSPALPRSCPTSSNMWRSIIPHLTPDLDDLDFGTATISDDSGYNSPSSDAQSPPMIMDMKPPSCSASNELTPTNPYIIPRVLEPAPRESKTAEHILPPLPRLGPLPTPVMTPQTSNFSTPAVGAYGLCPRKSSMSIAMAQAQNLDVSRVLMDSHPNSTGQSCKPMLPGSFPTSVPTSARRTSLGRSVSSFSSPESMVSDVSSWSSRSSRSSSISSVASSTCALPQPRLAVQATRRCANMQLPCVKENQLPGIPTSNDRDSSWESLWASSKNISGLEHDFFSKPRKAQKKTDFEPPPDPAAIHNASAQEAAAALRDLALNHRTRTQSIIHPSCSRKRGRPLSMDLSVQNSVRDLIAPRCRGDLTSSPSKNGDGGKILRDSRLADSFLVPKENRKNFENSSNKLSKPALAKDGLSRKRTCAGGGGKEEARRMDILILEQAGRPGPGMWDGVI